VVRLDGEHRMNWHGYDYESLAEEEEKLRKFFRGGDK
jgi:hypothetical protein